jgi:hypothetical protein
VLKGNRERREITYAGLAEEPAAIGVVGNEGNINNKIGRDGFTAALVLQCLRVLEAASPQL